jgi:hypothetical protein
MNHIGTIVKGNGEPTCLMPPNMTNGLFEKLQALGSGLTEDGRFEPHLIPYDNQLFYQPDD